MRTQLTKVRSAVGLVVVELEGCKLKRDGGFLANSRQAGRKSCFALLKHNNSNHNGEIFLCLPSSRFSPIFPNT